MSWPTRMKSRCVSPAHVSSEPRWLVRDLRTDVAVVKIDTINRPIIRVGDPAQLQTGEWVLAIGSPFGLQIG